MHQWRESTEIIARGVAADNELKLETATTLDEIAALRPCYDALLAVTGNTLPFALHEWHLAWCRHFLNCNPAICDEPLFCVLRTASGLCVAIVPLVVSRRRVGPLAIVSVSLLGADPAITEVRTPIIHPGYEALTARAVQRHLATIGHWDWIHWSGISHAFAAALQAGGRLQWQPVLSDFVLDMAPTWEEYRLRLKRNIRESLRHCYNSLKRDHHRYELQVISEPAELARGLDRFLQLHILRANLKTTTEVHPNRFASEVSRKFLYEVCERLSRRGAVRLFQLKVGSQIVAMRIGFVVRDSLYLYYSGFDPAWSRYSVMTTTLAEAIKYAISQGLRTVNLSPTKDVSKMRWSPRQVDYRSAFEVSGGLRSRLAHGAYLNLRSGAGLSTGFLRHLIPARRDWH
jgi:CelD/BcsL family acetyltransferase involved in cellulose biosynthesis